MRKKSKPVRGSTVELRRCPDCHRRYRAQVLRRDALKWVSIHGC